MVMRMGYSDTGEYDTDRNFVYSAKGTYGTSGWMGRKEMKGVLDLVPDLRKHKGIVLGMLDGKAVCIPENPRINGNLAVYGSSGSMKTRSFCMNRILQAVIRGESLIISDPKSELYEKSSEYLRYQGYCVKVFNLVLPENSDSWNCLSEVEGQELLAQIFVDVIIKNTTNNGKGDHFWDSCEMNLLKALVLYVDQSYAAENRNIGEVYRLLTLNGESDLDNLFDVLPPTHPAKAPYSLFKQASEKAPCIVFIDEIDTIGKKRDGAGMGGNDEREQTLNQLLTEMDGFDGTKGVVILAATNRPESLDPALLRPGRFDRRIPVQLPDLQGRIAILKVHAKDVHMSGNIDFNSIARATSGASGADLANIINEAALRAVRLGRNSVIQADLDESVETVIAGAQRKNAVLSAKEKEIVAYHEIGHALVAAKQTDSAPVTKITIVPRTSGALGYTMQVDEGEHNLMSKDELLNKVATLTGGRAAEELIFGSITTGASNDIEQATKLTRSMITRYGMSRKFDMVALETVTNQYLSGDTALACSAETAAKIDEEVIATVKTAHEKAIGILQNNMDALHRLAHFLLEKETITGEEFMDLLHKSE